jgi:8-oxo-dGTP pyrophosphatase MutT (NUDIX family)
VRDRPPRHAAALAYLFERGGALWLPLTVRPAHLREHAGQVSLPGGRPRPDEDLWRTALREAHEEIGLPPALPTRLGALAPVYIPVSHTRLVVQVAGGPEPPPFAPDPREVERVVLVRLAALLDPASRASRRRAIAGREVEVPYFAVEGLFLWGATAMALSELAARLAAAG